MLTELLFAAAAIFVVTKVVTSQTSAPAPGTAQRPRLPVGSPTNGGDGGGRPRFHPQGKLVPCPGETGSPSGTRPPLPGVASVEGFRWCYLIAAGETAGDVAEDVVGTDGRYQELLLANPGVKKVGDAGVYSGPRAWNFAPGSVPDGSALGVPEPWTAYVDQTGRPRRGTSPFPEDTRASSASAPTPTAGFDYEGYGDPAYEGG